MVHVSRTLQRENESVRDIVHQKIQTKPHGELGTLDYRLQFHKQNGHLISPWHSVPFSAGHGLVNFVCEIPKNTSAKFEVSTTEIGNPIKQDSKKGKPRSYALNILWNYGMIPQTWEDPTHASKDCGNCLGDNDPVDVVEIGERSGATGEIYAVKPVGAFAMIDEGELDWKVVAISVADPRCDLVNDVTDMETYFPGTLSAIREWFRTYKTFDGKPENKFELGEQCMNRDYTMGIIKETHGFWRAMVKRVKAGEDGMAVGDVPIPSITHEHIAPALHVYSVEEQQAVAETVKQVLIAVHGHEEELEAALGHGIKRHPSKGDIARSEVEHDIKRLEVTVASS